MGSDYAELFASFAGEFVDLRGVSPRPDCLHHEPAVGYPAGNELAEWTRQNGYDGLSTLRFDMMIGHVWSPCDRLRCSPYLRGGCFEQ